LFTIPPEAFLSVPFHYSLFEYFTQKIPLNIHEFPPLSFVAAAVAAADAVLKKLKTLCTAHSSIQISVFNLTPSPSAPILVHYQGASCSNYTSSLRIFLVL
jgi:hypothetical protein